MDAMLHALGGILLRAVPTFLLVILLHFYLKSIFFKPLEKVLHKRYEATEGARKLAATEPGAGGRQDRQLRRAIARRQGARCTRLKSSCTNNCRSAKPRPWPRPGTAPKRRSNWPKTQLAADVEAAKASMAADSESLANQIAETILRRNAA